MNAVLDPGVAREPRRRGVAILALLALTVAAFLPVLDAGFHYLDDPAYVTANPHVLQGLTPRGIAWAFGSFTSANWHPLTWLSHMADVSLFGLRPGAHHGVNLALHAAAAVLLLLALERLTGALWPALLAASLFAVHPLRVESVAWVAERKDVLAGMLAMAALLAYLRHVRHPRPGRYPAVVAIYALGLMAKPTLVTLPFALLLLDWWPLGRLRRPPPCGTAPPAAVRGRVILEKLPLLALAAASSVVTYLAQKEGQAVLSTDVFPLAARIGNALVSYAGYLGKTLWPQGLIPFYPHPGPILSFGPVAAASALLAATTSVALAFRRRRPWLITGWLWYLGTLVPMLGLVQVGLQGMADRYSYLPGIGLALALAWEARAAARRRPRLRGALVAGAAGILAVLAALTARQCGYWQDTVRLLTRVVEVDPQNSFAFNMLGTRSLEQGDAETAASLFSRALELRPGYGEARYNLGLALARSGRKAEALAQFSAMIRSDPRDAESLYNRGRLLLEAGRAGEALRDFDAALAVRPGEPQLQRAREEALRRQGALHQPGPPLTTRPR